MDWDHDVLDALDRMSIYRRERMRERLAAHAARAGLARVTVADLDHVQRQGMDRTPEEPLASAPWPALPGVYQVVDPSAPVAICTLASEHLVEPLSALPGVAIVGRSLTENLGVEKVALNLVANGAIRTLVLCGTESRHAVGDTLRQLHRAGLDESGRVIGSRGPTPVLRNFPAIAQRVFRERLALVDLVDETDVARIAAAVAEAASAVPPAGPAEEWRPPVSLATPEPAAAPAWDEDPAGFVLIGLGPRSDRIVAEIYTREAERRCLVQARTAEELTDAMLRAGAASSLAHASYLGREASRAETALRLGLAYEQDRPFDRTAPPER